MKKPVPRDPPASIDATAGTTRLTTSSSDNIRGGSATRAAGTGAGGWTGAALDTTSGMSANDRSEVAARAGASATATGPRGSEHGRGAASLDRNGNIAAPTTTTRPTASMVPRLEESGATSPSAGTASSTGTSPAEKPQRQTSTRRGTCRVQAGQVQAGRSDEGVSISGVGGSPIYRPITGAAITAAAASGRPSGWVPSGGGASRRRRSGSADTRARVAAGADTPERPRRWTISASGDEQDRSAARADGRAQVDIFGVEEEALVEASDRLEVLPPDQQTGAADPVDGRLRAVSSLDQRADQRHAPVVAGDEELLAQFGERATSCGRTRARRGRARRRCAVRRRRPRVGVERRGEPVDGCQGGPRCRG